MRSPIRTVSTAAAGALVALAAAAPADAAPQSGTVDCRPVPVAAVHGGSVAYNEQLTRIRDGRVLAIDASSSRQAQVPFRGRWVRTADGRRMAVAGQELRHGGRLYVVAARLQPGPSVACVGRQPVKARAADTASSTADGHLSAGYYRTEMAASTRNTTGRPLDSYENQVVCTGTSTHPDGAVLYSHPTPTTWCFKGRSSWLSSPSGIDGDCSSTTGYTSMAKCNPDYEFCNPRTAGDASGHVIIYLAATVLAQKRPSTKPNGEIIPTSAIAWRPAISKMYYPAGFNPETNRIAPPPRRTITPRFSDSYVESCVWRAGTTPTSPS